MLLFVVAFVASCIVEALFPSVAIWVAFVASCSVAALFPSVNYSWLHLLLHALWLAALFPSVAAVPLQAAGVSSPEVFASVALA